MMKKPVKHVPNIFSFLEPLSREVWLCVVFSFIAVSVVLFIVSRFSSSEWHLLTPEDQQYYRLFQHRYPDPTATPHGTPQANAPILINDFSILNCFWFSVGALLQQGSNLTPRWVYCDFTRKIDSSCRFIIERMPHDPGKIQKNLIEKILKIHQIFKFIANLFKLSAEKTDFTLYFPYKTWKYHILIKL